MAHICVNKGPWVDHQSNMARDRSTPKNGVNRPATMMNTPRTRRILGVRDAGATQQEYGAEHNPHSCNDVKGIGRLQRSPKLKEYRWRGHAKDANGSDDKA